MQDNDHGRVTMAAARAEKTRGGTASAENNRDEGGGQWLVNHDRKKLVKNHDGRKPWLTTHGSDERGHYTEGEQWTIFPRDRICAGKNQGERHGRTWQCAGFSGSG